ncbi:lipopolysaccharide assembly protein LapA domain-containing protein [Roseomonas sp. CAU 1739]|uniref:lipopolysaccharide assembly protein LapA domain-containing protein n=1 Tax=Roseomonas sp. CAU 1739 TaxID=3140364 RepID=UPI00325AE726
MMRWIIFIPFAAVVVLFALSNRQPVDLRLWPFDLVWQAPLSVAVLAAAAVAFLIGAGIVWVSGMPQRSRARASIRRAEGLQREVDTARARERAAAADRLAGPTA